MKLKIRLYALSSDDDEGTNSALFAEEYQAVDALLDKLGASTTVQTQFEEYTRDQLKHFYFSPENLPESYEDFFELINEIKDPADNYNIGEHIVEVEGVNVPFIQQISQIVKDGEILLDQDGFESQFVLGHERAVSTLHSLIDEARRLTGRNEQKNQTAQVPCEATASPQSH
jgi:hypothetical protein